MKELRVDLHVRDFLGVIVFLGIWSDGVFSEVILVPLLCEVRQVHPVVGESPGPFESRSGVRPPEGRKGNHHLKPQTIVPDIFHQNIQKSGPLMHPKLHAKHRRRIIWMRHRNIQSIATAHTV